MTALRSAAASGPCSLIAAAILLAIPPDLVHATVDVASGNIFDAMPNKAAPAARVP